MLDDKFVPFNMLKSGEWGQFEGTPPSAVGITLTYQFVERTINLTIKSDKIAGSGSKQKAVFHGNFHHNIRAEQGESHKVAIAIVDDWKNDLKDFELLTANMAEGIAEQ